MWNSIVNAAKAVYHAIVPVKKPVVVAKPSSGGLQVKPIVTQPTLSVKPYTAPINQPGVKVNVVSPQQVAAQQQQKLSVQPLPGQSAQQAEAIRQATIVAAQKSQQSNLAKLWQAALSPAGKLGDIYAQYKGKQYLKKQLTVQNENIPGMVDKWRGAADKNIAQARQDLASGKISADQFNVIVDKERGKLEKNAKSYTDYFNSEQKQIDAPYPGAAKVAGAINGFQKAGGGIFGNIWKYSLGSGNKNIPSLVTIPARGINTAKNMFGMHTGEKGNLNPLTSWQKSFNQPIFNNAELAKMNQPIYMTDPKTGRKILVSGSATPATNQNFRGQAANAIADPINFLGAGWASKGLKFAPKLAGAAAKTGFGQKVVNAANKFGETPFAKTVAKLGAPTRSTNQAWLDRVHETLNGTDNKFAQLKNSNEAQAYQDLMQGKRPNWAPDVDRVKVSKFADEQRALYNAMHQAENAAGFGTKYRPGYLPTKTTATDNFLSSVFKKTNNVSEGLPVEQMRRAEAFKQWEHIKTLEKAGLTDKSGEALKILGKKAFTNKQYAKMFESVSSKPSVLKNAPNKRFLSTDTSTLAKIPHGAESAWKTAVLKYNPAWYVHNAMWNAPASFLAGGTKTFGGYAKMFKKGSLEALPKELKDGAFGGLGGKIENLSRGAAYHAGIAKGMTHQQALKNVDKYLFDYSKNSNWEKPLRAVLPFWSWQKNIARLAAQLPNSNPIASNAFHQIDQNNQRALNQIPEKGVSYTDPETGRTETVDPRKQFEGKIKTPFGWISAAGLPIMPSQLSQFGINPALSTAKRFFTGKDYFGNPTNGESIGSLAASNTPQTKLVTSMKGMFDKSGTANNWISASGYSKGSQGIDPSKPNYKASLDPTHSFFAALKSLSGVPFATKFDEGRFRESLRYDQFSKEYFSHDWNKEYPDYDARVAAQKAAAGKYGYDLQKDIYDGKWSKYDSPQTAALKERGNAARELQTQVYDIYNKLPAKTGARSQFIQMWKTTMAGDDFKGFNPDFNVFKNVAIKGDMPTQKGGFSNIASTKFAKPTAQSAKASFWKGYYATTDKAARSAMLKANPQYAKLSTAATDPKKAKIKWAYDNLPPDVRTRWLRKEGLIDTSRDNWTDAQWKTYLASTGNDFNSKFGRDLTAFPKLGEMQLANVTNITNGFAPRAKIGRAVKFGGGFSRSLTKKR